MSKKDIDRYLSKVPQPQRKTLESMRKMIHAAVPVAEECISYNMPAFKVDGQVIGGFAAFQNHCSYFPFSGSVVDMLKSELSGYDTNKGTIRFATNRPLPARLLKKLLSAGLQVASKKHLKKTGTARNYYEDGILQSQGKIVKGRMHGKWQWFRKDGTIMRSGEFDRDEQVGTWRTYDRSGQLVKETTISKKLPGKRPRG